MSLGADKVKAAKSQTLKSEFEALSKKENESLDDFYLKLHGLVTNIRALGEKMEENYMVKKLLRAFPSKFLHIASALEQFGKLEEMFVEEGQLLLTKEEWRQKDNQDGKLLLTREEWLKRSNKEGTQGGGEYRGKEAVHGVRDRSKIRCFNCQAYGHFSTECRKPRKEKEGYKEVNSSQIQRDEQALLVAEIKNRDTVNMLLKEETVVLNLRAKGEEQIHSQVKFGDGSMVYIKGGCIISFKCKNGEEKTLKDSRGEQSHVLNDKNRARLMALARPTQSCKFSSTRAYVKGEDGPRDSKIGLTIQEVRRVLNVKTFQEFIPVNRKMWVYMLKEKSIALEMFKKFKALVENRTGKRMKMLRTDRGGEFCSKEFTSYCEDVGIERQYTVPYIPQQNGVVERRNRTVAAMVKSFIKGSKMPSFMWGETVRHSVHILNSKQAVYLGREPGTKGNYLYNPITESVHISRDVVFLENEFWPWEQTGNTGVLIRGHVIKFEESQETNHNVETEQVMSTLVRTHHDETEEESAERIDFSSVASSEPRRFRSLDEIYNETKVIDKIDELMLLKAEEPTFYSEASAEQEWMNAMKAKVETIEKNRTWVLTDLLVGHKPMGLKWVYKLKKDSEGNVVKYKARLVAKGYVQRKGIDYKEVFAPVAHLEMIRLFLALTAKEGWEVHHLDVKSAFLNGELLEEVYVMQPEGFIKKGQELAGASKTAINEFKKEMNQQFEMSDLGLLSYYLGIEKLQLDKDGGELVNANEYRCIFGSLRYLTHSRPNISYAVGVMRFTDSDLAGDVVDRRSTGGMCFYLNGNLISWASQKHRVIALSSCDAEYMAATIAACQSIWLRGLLKEISGQQIGSIILYINNKSAIELMKDRVLHGRSKHIDMRFYFIRECIERGELVVQYVGTH
ncbi:hypothetical protein AgCh_000066 [Apium graveolens]